MRLSTTALIPLAFAIALSAPALAGSIQISGHGEVTAAPDTAYVTSGVTSQGATAKQALDANTTAMNALITALKTAGIDSRDIQTSGFSVNPNYVYSDARDANGYQLPPRINGYTVMNNVTVHVRDLASLGGLLDQAVTVGSNTISGITFAVEDPAALYDDARKSAFADARKKAELYASVAGTPLGALSQISEQQGFGNPQPLFRAVAAQDSGSAVPVEAGQLTFAIDVNVTWDLATQ